MLDMRLLAQINPYGIPRHVSQPFALSYTSPYCRKTASPTATAIANSSNRNQRFSVICMNNLPPERDCGKFGVIRPTGRRESN
jgi:hypothetical protein